MAASQETEKGQSEIKNIVLDLTAGSIGGIAGVILGHPLDVVKTRMQALHSQLRTPSALECMSTTVRSEGVLGLWRGVVPPVVAVGFWQAVVFASYEWTFKKFVAAGVTEDHARWAGGLFSGAASCLVTVPFDAVKIQLQLETGSQSGAVVDSLRCGRRMFQTSGFVPFFRGMSSCLIRDVPNTALYLVAYAKAKEVCIKCLGEGAADDYRGLIAELLAGGFSGSLTWACACPMDVVKTVQQETACSSVPLSLTAATREVYRRDGVRGFARGFWPLVIRAFPVNAVTFLVYERLKCLFGVPSTL